MHFLFQLTVVFEDKLMGIHSLFLWYSICEIEKNPFFSCCFVKVMNESSIELIKDSCCFRMGGNCASSLLKKLFVAWSGLRYSFYHVMEKGQPSSFCSLLAAGQVTSVSLDCELRLRVLFWGVEWMELLFWFSTNLLTGGRIVRMVKQEKLDWIFLFFLGEKGLW